MIILNPMSAESHRFRGMYNSEAEENKALATFLEPHRPLAWPHKTTTKFKVKSLKRIGVWRYDAGHEDDAGSPQPALLLDSQNNQPESGCLKKLLEGNTLRRVVLLRREQCVFVNYAQNRFMGQRWTVTDRRTKRDWFVLERYDLHCADLKRVTRDALVRILPASIGGIIAELASPVHVPLPRIPPLPDLLRDPHVFLGPSMDEKCVCEPDELSNLTIRAALGI
jgi:hypothetical protein